MAKCPNRNTNEYKVLRQKFKTNIATDNIINAWQELNNSDQFPTLAQANEFVKNQKTFSNLQKREFADTLLANLSRLNLIHKYNDNYYVTVSSKVITDFDNREYNEKVARNNQKAIQRYLYINNIPAEAININEIEVDKLNRPLFTVTTDLKYMPSDVLKASENRTSPHSGKLLVHLKRLFPELNIEVLEVNEARKYYEELPEEQKRQMPFDKVKSFYVNETAVLIKGRTSDETAIEEILHPFIDALYLNNRQLFDNLLEEAKENFPALWQNIQNSYTNNRGFTETERNLELVTQSLSRYFNNEFENNPTQSLKDRVVEFLKWFAGIVNNFYKFLTGLKLSTMERDIDYYQGDQALMEQEEVFDDIETTPTIKPGVSELFESNPELAEIGTQQQYSQYLDSLNKPNTNPILQGNQQEQVKKFAELQERLNNKEFLEGARNAYESTPALQQFGTQEQYNDYIARVSLGIIKNPTSGEYNYTSKVKDIVYRGSKYDIKDAKNIGGIWAGTKLSVDSFLKLKGISSKSVLFNIKNPKIFDSFWTTGRGPKVYVQEALDLVEKTKDYKTDKKEQLKKEAISEGYDGIIINTDAWYELASETESFPEGEQYVVFEPKQIHTLGSKQDIEGFKEFVDKSQVTQTEAPVYRLNVRDFNSSMTLSDVARMLNTSDIEFKLGRTVNNKVRYSLTPEKQRVVEYALSQAQNPHQANVIKRMFNTAMLDEAEFDNLVVGVSEPTPTDSLIAFDKDSHTYIDIMTGEPYLSATTAIKGGMTLEKQKEVQLNLEIGNEFDIILDAIVSDQSFDSIKDNLKL